MYPCLICTLRKAYVKLNLIYMICDHMETQMHAVMGEASTSKGKDQVEEKCNMPQWLSQEPVGRKDVLVINWVHIFMLFAKLALKIHGKMVHDKFDIWYAVTHNKRVTNTKSFFFLLGITSVAYQFKRAKTRVAVKYSLVGDGKATFLDQANFVLINEEAFIECV